MNDAATAGSAEPDHVILLNDDGSVRGLAPRATVHSTSTPLHLAFSCYVLDEEGRLLLTRRALSKRTWPGVWTNAFCGHPRQGETIAEAVTRHAEHELGMRVRNVREVLPDFRYRAVDASGVVENEVCPVYLAEAEGTPVANPEEVMDLRWSPPQQIIDLVALAPWTLSPWMVSQVPALRASLGGASSARGRTP
jgi:isopentenyl-diphosphate delta-isomerase